jgi:hypothetical protein
MKNVLDCRDYSNYEIIAFESIFAKCIHPFPVIVAAEGASLAGVFTLQAPASLN